MQTFKSYIYTFLLLIIFSHQLFSQSPDHNYIKSTTIKVEGITNQNNICSLQNNQKQVDIKYFDGLGRLNQEINLSASPNQKDIIRHIEYDAFGRISKEYLPFTTILNNNGNFYENCAATTEYAYTNYYSWTNPYTQKIYDDSPLNIVEQVIAPGASSLPVKTHNFTNSASQIQVIKWKCVNDDCVKSGYYPTSSLYITETEDENGNKTRIYKNPRGEIILQASLLDNYWLKTYSVYDELGMLRFVIPPKATKKIEGGRNFNSLKNDLCFVYKYDKKQRLIYKKLPGTEPIYMIYNDLDLLIFLQDGNMRNNTTEYNEWQYTKYDALKRPIITGIYKDMPNLSQSQMVNFVKLMNSSSNALWEEYDTIKNIYTNNCFPGNNLSQSKCKTLSITYYDNYLGLFSEHQFVAADFSGEAMFYKSNYTKGLQTSGITYILDDRDSEDLSEVPKDMSNSGGGLQALIQYLKTTIYYDDYGRVVQTISDNYKEGRDRISNLYNFAGELLKTKITHTVKGQAPQTLLYTYTYDHAGRLLNTSLKINDLPEQILSENQYNELQRLSSKTLGNAQQVDYTYDILGRIRQVNDLNELGNDLFAYKLFYEDGANPQYNGNISAIEWKTPTKTQKQNYQYDAINRLLSADSDYSTGYSYDLNGNILSLKRLGMTSSFEIPENSKSGHFNFGLIDDLKYTYTGNQLKSILDYCSNVISLENDFKGNYSNQSNFYYLYDFNGNMTYDPNKEMTINYNYLNLPQNINFVGTNNKISYIYSSDGTKLQKQVSGSMSKITDYIGSFIYEDNELQYIIHPEGRYAFDNKGKGHFEYNILDHLGNVRVTFDTNASGQILPLQENHYYPFGLQINSLSSTAGHFHSSGNKGTPSLRTESQYKYNGKELQTDYNLDWHDYGARNYDAQIGRWHSVDPLAEKYYPISLYAYVANNPIIFIDPDGRFVIDPNATRKQRRAIKQAIRRVKRFIRNNDVQAAMQKFGQLDYKQLKADVKNGQGPLIKVANLTGGGHMGNLHQMLALTN